MSGLQLPSLWLAGLRNGKTVRDGVFRKTDAPARLIMFEKRKHAPLGGCCQQAAMTQGAQRLVIEVHGFDM